MIQEREDMRRAERYAGPVGVDPGLRDRGRRMHSLYNLEMLNVLMIQ
jgi:hypothetical protein